MDEQEERWIDSIYDDEGNELTDDDLSQQLAAEQMLLESLPMPDAAPRTEAVSYTHLTLPTMAVV